MREYLNDCSAADDMSDRLKDDMTAFKLIEKLRVNCKCTENMYRD